MTPGEHKRAAEKALETAHDTMAKLTGTRSPVEAAQAYAAQIHALAAVAQAHALLAALPVGRDAGTET